MPVSATFIRLSFASALLAAGPATAQWTGKGEAGLAFASGNSDSKTANGRIELLHKRDAWEHKLNLGGLYVSSEGETSAQRWDAGGQSRFDFHKNTFWYGGARYEEDRFGGFDYQGLLATGIGHRFIDSDTTKLLVQVGAGYKQWEVLDAPGHTEDNITGVASMEFEHQLTGTTRVYDKFGSEFGPDNNLLQNEIGVLVKMTDRMALSVAYNVRNNSEPPEGFRHTDTLTTVNLVYETK